MISSREKHENEQRKQRMADAMNPEIRTVTTTRTNRRGVTCRSTFRGTDSEILRLRQFANEYRDYMGLLREIVTSLDCVRI